MQARGLHNHKKNLCMSNYADWFKVSDQNKTKWNKMGLHVIDGNWEKQVAA